VVHYEPTRSWTRKVHHTLGRDLRAARRGGHKTHQTGSSAATVDLPAAPSSALPSASLASARLHEQKLTCRTQLLASPQLLDFHHADTS